MTQKSQEYKMDCQEKEVYSIGRRQRKGGGGGGGAGCRCSFVIASSMGAGKVFFTVL